MSAKTQNKERKRCVNMTERNVTLQVRCMCCDQINRIKVTEESAVEYLNPNRKRFVQDIFPYLNSGERELLISKTCPKCWNMMFGDSE